MKQYRVWKDGRVVETPFPGVYAGITTTKVFGRLNCKSGMRAKKEHRIFFHFWEDAIAAGFRPCRKCKPAMFSRRSCNHRPFGLTGGLALEIERTKRGQLRVTCALCEKFLGYAKEDISGRVQWHDGFIVPLGTI